jgi:hypothetical protein
VTNPITIGLRCTAVVDADAAAPVAALVALETELVEVVACFDELLHAPAITTAIAATAASRPG